MRGGRPGKENSNYKHGYAKTREYYTWADMVKRCTKTYRHNYYRYGGRGIKVCKRWLNVANFITDMGLCPKGYTLDRIDTNKNYCKSNCRWADKHTQYRNRSDNHWITKDNETHCITDWCKIIGISYSTVRSRLRHKWTVKRALFSPVDRAANCRRAYKKRRKQNG